MSRFGRFVKRLFGKKKKRGSFVSPPVIVPPDPLYGELEFTADGYSVIDTQANYVAVFVSRTNGDDEVVTVQYRTVPGTATPGVDYTPVTGTLTWFNQDQQPKGFIVPILPRDVSGDFTFDVEIHTPGGGVTIIPGGESSPVLIERRGFGEADFAGPNWYVKNPDPAPPTTLTLFVQRNLAFKGTVTVDWQTVPGTALPGIDYDTGSGTLTWVDGDGSPKAIVINIPARAGGPFPDRDFTVLLDNPTGGLVIGSTNPATCTVTDGVAPANPTVTASIPNQIVDDMTYDETEILVDAIQSMNNDNITCNAYAGIGVIEQIACDLLGVFFAFTTGAGCAVGTNAIAIRSTTSGQLWSNSFPDIGGRTLRGVGAGSSVVFWAVGDDGRILKTVDGGTNWVEQVSGTTEDLYGVWAADVNNAWAVGANGTILSTADGGANWAAQTSGTTELLRGVIFTFGGVSDGWAVGENGTILETSDGGANWNAQTSGTTEDLHGVWLRDANFAVAVGTNGTILKTVDGGANWTTETSGTTEDLHGVNMFSTLVGWAVGANGTILNTTDGTTWAAQTSGTTENLNSLNYTEGTGNVVVAVGDDMTILRTTDAGANWVTVIPPDSMIGVPPATSSGGIDYSNSDDTFYPTSRFALSGMIS